MALPPFLLPPFLLLDDSYSDVEAFVALAKRIGLANAVKPMGSLADARRFLTACDVARLPVVVFAGGAVRDGHADSFAEWMLARGEAIAGIPLVPLVKPLDMRVVIDALKALALPETTKIDPMTLTVRVELWPRGHRPPGR